MPRTCLSARCLVSIILATTICVAPAPSQAQSEYPNRLVRIMVGAVAGGSSDTGGRLLAAKLSERFGQTFVIENKPGAAGAVASTEVARAEPNGHTLLFTASWHSTSAAIKKSLPYDSVKDFTFISTMMTYGMLIGVHPQSRFQSLPELIAFAKANPGKLSYYSVGPGSAHHLLGESLIALTGAEMVHVPFRGSATALPDFLAGRVDVMIETMTVALAHAKAGKVRPLAITAPEPMPELPGVPLLKESVPGLEYESWLGLMAPRGLPAPTIEKLNTAMREIVAMPEISQRIKELGAVPRTSTSDEFRARVAREIAQFKQVVEARKIPLQ